jgi:iron complex outermembrane receptor protein
MKSTKDDVRVIRGLKCFSHWGGWLIALGLIIIASRAPAQTNSDVPPPTALKNLTLEELMDLDVTSVAKQPEPYGQAPAAIQVITGDEIRRSGASSIPEALRLADSLDVAQKNSHDWAISARGFNTSLANKLLVLVDGRTVYTPLFAGVFWDAHDYLLEDIDRIEVISGPGGTLWGANAVNGVINITTKSAKDTQGLYVESGGGSELQDFGGARYGGTLASNVYFRVYGKYLDRNSEVFPNGNDAADSWNQGQGGFRMDAEPSLQNTITLQGDYYAGHENITTGGRANVAGGNVLNRWTHTFANDSDMSLQMYYDRTHLSDPIAASTDPYVPRLGRLIDNLDTYDVDFQDRFHWGERNHFVWGLGYRYTHEVDQNASNLAFLPSTLDQNLSSGFVQDEIMLLDDLSFTLGTKVEHNGYTGFEEEPSGRIQWNVTPKQMVWAAVSRAVRMPSRVDEDEHLPIPSAIVPNFLTGNSNFVSETEIAFELGYRAQLGQKVSTSVSTFYNLYNDVRSANFSPPPAILGYPITFQNNLKGETYGFELTADYQILDWWRLHGGYDLLKENIYVKSGQTDINNALNETADPQQQFSIRSSMDLPKNVELDAALRWVDSFQFNNSTVPGTVPGYFELDTRLAWHPTKHLEISVVGQNLLHDQHLEYISPPAPQEEIVRSIYGKITWQF